MKYRNEKRAKNTTRRMDERGQNRTEGHMNSEIQAKETIYKIFKGAQQFWGDLERANTNGLEATLELSAAKAGTFLTRLLA